MPITITGPNGQGVIPIGPGSFLDASSSFIGPHPDGTQFEIDLTSDPEGGHILLQGSIASTSPGVTFQLGVDSPGVGWTWAGLAGVTDGANVYVQARQVEPGNVIVDSGTQAMPWSVGAAGEAWQVAQPSSGGLTPTEQQQLQDTTDSSFLVKLFNAVVEEPLVPSPVPGPINATLDTPVYGCIVRIASVPPAFQPIGPDADYWVKTLATVRVFRGSDIWLRAPIHTSSKVVSFWGEHLIIGLAAIWAQQWLQQITLQVFFLEGVTGTVTLLHLP